MSIAKKQLSNPFSTGAGGSNFETRVQTSFATLMLAGGFIPCLPFGTITKIKLQGQFAGYATDDLIVYLKVADEINERKLFGQIKHAITITDKSKVFGEVIVAAWSDYNSKHFERDKDLFALITGPLSSSDINDLRTILEWARTAENSREFFKNVNLYKFSSNGKRNKLNAFRVKVTEANGGKKVTDKKLFEFLKHFHILGYDLDIKSGVTLALLHSLIKNHSPQDATLVWAKLLDYVQYINQNAGTIKLDQLPDDLVKLFKKTGIESIPEGYAVPSEPKKLNIGNTAEHQKVLAVANLLGLWNEDNAADIKIVKDLIDGF